MTVYVHNSGYGSRTAAQAELLATEGDVRSWTWWNLWKLRARPYHLEDGDDVLLLSSWPGGGTITWHVRAVDVHKGVYAGWGAATDALARWAGLPVADVRSEPYTAGKRGADPGVVLAWRAEPVARLDLARPAGLSIGYNGWLVTSREELATLGVELGEDVRGDERPDAVDPERNRAVELRAEEAAAQWCEQRGWTDVRRTGDVAPWDLEARDERGNTRFVEVKGTTGDGLSVTVTRNEVRAAREHGSLHSLVVVAGIGVEYDETGWPQANGGTLTAHDPWHPQEEELIVISYTWSATGRG